MAHANGQPARDGEWTLYTPDDGVEFSPADELIFVNGVNNTGADHAGAAKKIANLARHRVDGVYNLTGNRDDHFLKVAAKQLETDPMARAVVAELLAASTGTPHVIARVMADLSLRLEAKAARAGGSVAGFLADIGQCVQDWLAAAIVGSIINEDPILGQMPTVFLPPPLQALRVIHELQKTPRLSSDQRMTLARTVFLAGNRATSSLFERLSALCQARGPIRIVAHSQGNLVAANAISALCWAKGPQSIGQVTVYSLASPVPRLGWPTAFGFTLRLYAKVGDLVPWLSLGKSFAGHGGMPPSTNAGTDHAIERYMEIPDFIQTLRRDMHVPEEAAPVGVQAA